MGCDFMKQKTNMYIKKLHTVLKKPSDSRGFSLVEMVIVIAIMVILLSMLAPAVFGYIKKAQLTADHGAGKTIYEAFQMALNDPDFYAQALKASQLIKDNTSLDKPASSRLPIGFDKTRYKAYHPFLRTALKNGGKFGEVGEWMSAEKSQPAYAEHTKLAKMFQKEFEDKKIHISTRMAPADSTPIAGSVTDQFVILMRKGNPRDIEIWLGSSGGFWENGLTIRLYPI